MDNITAFSELFEHYRPALYGLCCRRLNDPSLAEDVVQEVFLKAFKSLSSYDRDKLVWPWLSTIALRMCIDLQRHRSLTHYSADLRAVMEEVPETNGHTESALDELIASEDRAEIWRSLDVLPERQRRVFLSYVMDGMSYAEIAAAEGISIGAVELLLVRARKKMRKLAGGHLPAIFLPLNWLRWKLQQMEDRVRPLLSAYGEGFSTACAQAACLGALVTVVVATGLPRSSIERDAPIPSEETVLSASQSRPLQAALLKTALPSIGAAAKAPVETQQSFAYSASSLVDAAVNPNQNATPENSGLYSIAASPNYENDHMILMSGHYWGRHVLFVSRDGGANWQAQVSLTPSGIQSAMVFSPDFLRDRRLLTIGELGLHQSDDGGAVFRALNPVMGWGLAISPSFGRKDSLLNPSGDSKVLIGGATVLEYDVDTGATQPIVLPIHPAHGVYPSVTYSPGYPSDRTVFISDSSSDTFLYRCRASVCDETQFPFVGPLKLRLSPHFAQDGLAYAFTSQKLIFSKDGARTFQEIQIPRTYVEIGYIEDLAISWNTSDPLIFFSVHGRDLEHIVYRSFDGGGSWKATRINFYWGSASLIVTPTKRLLRAGRQAGVACSEDLGETWAPRCSPEQ